MENSLPKNKKIFRKLLFPLILVAFFGGLLVYGGEAYQAIGLAGIGMARIVLGYTVGVCAFLALAVFVRRVVQYVFLDWLIASAIGSQPPRLLNQIASFLVYLFDFTAIVGVVFKQDLTVVLTATGALGFVVALALQNLILDIFAGLALNLDRIVKLGDNVQLHKIGDKTLEGKITEISWRTMQILDVYNNTLIIPNRSVSAAVITNFSIPNPQLGTLIPIIVDGKVPVDRAIRILKAASIEAMSIVFPDTEATEPIISVAEIIHVPRSVKYNIRANIPFENRVATRNMIQQHVLRHLSFAGLRPKQQVLPDIAHLTTLVTMTELFHRVDESDARCIATHARLKVIEANETVTQRGEIAEVMFLVIEGLLTAKARHTIGTKTPQLQHVSPGNMIGWTPMMMNDVYEATVSSKTVCLLLEINFQILEKILAENPKLVDFIINNVTQFIVNKGAAEKSKWQMQEADVAAEILRNLNCHFTI